MRIAAATALLCALFATSSEARPRISPECNITMPCEVPYSAPLAQKRARTVQRSAPPAQKQPSEVVSHPDGCPHVAFCGCGAAVRVFGKAVRSLWLAVNWLGFSRTDPAPGMVGVTRHHVMVLESHVQGDQWVVYDANSGGHLTRVHVRSIAGYTIVNPHSGGV